MAAFLPTSAMRTRSAAFGQCGTKLNFVSDTAHFQGLLIGVADDKIYSGYALIEHVRHGIASASSYSDDFDD